MRNYELVLVINPQIADENVGAVTERVGQWIAASGGELVNTNPWGRRRLAYPIKDQREGTYVTPQFRMEPRATGELERSLKLSEDVLRYSLVRVGE